MGITASIVRRLGRPRRVWITIALAAGFLEIGLQYFSVHPHPFEKTSDRAARLAREHGIVIGYGHPSTFFVPPYGPSDAELPDRHVSGADTEDILPALDGVAAALAAYPSGFVGNLIDGIFIGGDILVNAERSGGFTGPTWFVLSASHTKSAEDIRFTNLIGVHHELSSFVLQKANVTNEWTAFAPATWPFTNTNEVALARGNDPDPSPETGFLSAYAATTAENDFNTYAERIFTDPDALVALACKHALVRKKLLFVLQTYVALDARMEKVFRDLGVDGAHLCERRWRWPW